MKTVAVFCVWCGLVASGIAAPKEQDEVQKGLRDAYKLYEENKLGEVSEKLKAILKILEERSAEKLEVILPPGLDDWEAGELVREDLTLLGGGISMKRPYHWGVKTVTVKLVKDAPAVKFLLPLLQNEDLIKLSGKKVHTVFGEKAVMENERRLQMVIDGKILLEVSGNAETKEKDVVELTRLLDVKLLKTLK